MEKGPVYLVQRTEMKCGLVQWEWIWKRVLNIVDEVAKVGGEVLVKEWSRKRNVLRFDK